MNILFITEKYLPFVVSGNRVYNLANNLNKYHKITIFTRENNRWLFPMPIDTTLKDSKNIKKFYFRINDSLFLIPTMILFKLGIISNSKFYFNSAKKIIEKNKHVFQKFDIVIASGPSWHAFYLAEYLYDNYSIPFILDYRDPWITKNKSELNIQKRIITKTKDVVTVSKQTADKINDILACDNNIKIIENGVDLNYFKQFILNKKNSNGLRIGYAGTFINYQQVDKLFFAIYNLPQDIKDNIVFEGCGSPFEKKYKKLAKKLNINANFYGHLNLFDMAKVLSKCDFLYVGNNIFNAVGGKFYIYLALNKPLLVYTKKGSQLDVETKNNKLGFLSYSIKELSNNIENYYLNKNNTKYIFKKNIINYIKKYDWKILSKKYVVLINKYLKNS